MQAHLRYNLSPATALSVGYGTIFGGENEVNGVKQNDKLKTQYARMTVTHFLNQTTQLHAQYGQDVSVVSGNTYPVRSTFQPVPAAPFSTQ
jgi:hypothetical protein